MSVALTPIARLGPPAIARHVHSLRAEVFARRFRPLLASLMEHAANGGVFNAPVDPVRLGIPDYPSIVKTPMDLGTVRQRLEALRYTAPATFAGDVRLVFQNAVRYNPAAHHVHSTASKLLDEFDRSLARYETKEEQDAARKATHSCGFCHGSVCGLCGEKCLKFDPPHISCDCCGARIRRGDTLYGDSAGHRWCVKCVNTGGMAHAGPGTVPAPTAVIYTYLSEIKEATAGCRSIAEAALAVRRRLPKDVSSTIILAARLAMQEEARTAQLTRIRVARRAASALQLHSGKPGKAAKKDAAAAAAASSSSFAVGSSSSAGAASSDGPSTPSSNAILTNLLRQEALTGLGPAEAIPLGTRSADAAVRSIALARAALAVSAPDTAGSSSPRPRPSPRAAPSSATNVSWAAAAAAVAQAGGSASPPALPSPSSAGGSSSSSVASALKRESSAVAAAIATKVVGAAVAGASPRAAAALSAVPAGYGFEDPWAHLLPGSGSGGMWPPPSSAGRTYGRPGVAVTDRASRGRAGGQAAARHIDAAAIAAESAGFAAPKRRSYAAVFAAAIRSRLSKRKNDEVQAEAWVQCDTCAGWFHQVCALFNERKNRVLPEEAPFACPLCLVDAAVPPRHRSTRPGASALAAAATASARGTPGALAAPSALAFSSSSSSSAAAAGAAAADAEPARTRSTEAAAAAEAAADAPPRVTTASKLASIASAGEEGQRQVDRGTRVSAMAALPIITPDLAQRTRTTREALGISAADLPIGFAPHNWPDTPEAGKLALTVVQAAAVRGARRARAVAARIIAANAVSVSARDGSWNGVPFPQLAILAAPPVPMPPPEAGQVGPWPPPSFAMRIICRNEPALPVEVAQALAAGESRGADSAARLAIVSAGGEPVIRAVNVQRAPAPAPPAAASSAAAAPPQQPAPSPLAALAAVPSPVASLASADDMALSAAALPHTSLSRLLETSVRARLAIEASVDVALSVTVRCVSSLPQNLQVPDEVRLLFRNPPPAREVVERTVKNASATASSGFVRAAIASSRRHAVHVLGQAEVDALDANPYNLEAAAEWQWAFSFAELAAIAAEQTGPKRPDGPHRSSAAGAATPRSGFSAAADVAPVLVHGAPGGGNVDISRPWWHTMRASRSASLGRRPKAAGAAASPGAPGGAPPPLAGLSVDGLEGGSDAAPSPTSTRSAMSGSTTAAATESAVYPSDMPFRQRVVLMFQRIDGVDVCIFALYTQEYGPDCPAPNARSLYVAYLDSVRFMRPLHARTPAYREVLKAYLEHARRNGFQRAFIWACPPQRGDAYIFHRHPPQQRTPTKDRLRRWYEQMLRESQDEGAVTHVTSLFDEYFTEDCELKPDAGLPPFFKGDFWATEAERVVRDLPREVRIHKQLAAKAKAKAAKDKRSSSSKTKTYRAKSRPRTPAKPPAAKGPAKGPAKGAAAASASSSSSSGGKHLRSRSLTDGESKPGLPVATSVSVCDDAMAVTLHPVPQPVKLERSGSMRSEAADAEPLARPLGLARAASAASSSSALGAGDVDAAADDDDAISPDDLPDPDVWTLMAKRLREMKREFFVAHLDPVYPPFDDRVAMREEPPPQPRALPVAPLPVPPAPPARAPMPVVLPVSSSSVAAGSSAESRKRPRDEDGAGVGAGTDARDNGTDADAVPVSDAGEDDDSDSDDEDDESDDDGSLGSDAEASARRPKRRAAALAGQRIARSGDSLRRRDKAAWAEGEFAADKEEEEAAVAEAIERSRAEAAAAKEPLAFRRGQPADEDDDADEEDGEAADKDEDAAGGGAASSSSSSSSAAAATDAKTADDDAASMEGAASDHEAPPAGRTAAASADDAGPAAKRPRVGAVADATPAAAVPARSETSDQACERMSCAFFDTRHGFLRMCQANNYQFDNLRRAKHSSAVIIWHLHNPSIPATDEPEDDAPDPDGMGIA